MTRSSLSPLLAERGTKVSDQVVGYVVVRESDGRVFLAPHGGWFTTVSLAGEAAAQGSLRYGGRFTIRPIGGPVEDEDPEPLCKCGHPWEDHKLGSWEHKEDYEPKYRSGCRAFTGMVEDQPFTCACKRWAPAAEAAS